jgi:hypothetical protein
VDVHLLGWTIEVCHLGLLLENVLDIIHTTAHQDPIRLLGDLDHREGQSLQHGD